VPKDDLASEERSLSARESGTGRSQWQMTHSSDTLAAPINQNVKEMSVFGRSQWPAPTAVGMAIAMASSQSLLAARSLPRHQVVRLPMITSLKDCTGSVASGRPVVGYRLLNRKFGTNCDPPARGAVAQ
jgi:hypothetical protein